MTLARPAQGHAPLLFAVLLAAATCGGDTVEARKGSLGVPAWSHEAIWYQIFVERFRNGDPANDPTLHDMRGSWPDIQPAGWAPTPWGHDWYAQEDWAAATGEGFYTTVQLRRYGGDLQGVLDQLDDLEQLGVTALYLNPINDAPSLHKYDARNYRHVDRNFGPDPRGDEALMAKEDPLDPATWVTTAADRLFLDLVGELHRRGMRIIVDYSWNHTGATFWAWQDVLENQAASRFADWYEIERFDDPATPDTSEFTYRGWAGVPYLPELKKVGRPEGETHGAIEGTLLPAVRDHVFNVTRRWLDPNGDGDPRDGVDGFRLDVAEMVPLGFWREYRTFVRGVNPEAYLVGEVWWERWPERMYDPSPWLQGDVFDAVMNYRWYAPTRSFFAAAPPGHSPDSYLAALEAIETSIPPDHVKAQMNLAASHDTPRLATSLYNPGRYKYNVAAAGNPEYRLDRPDDRTRRLQRMVLVQQFTWRGAPHIWYGDEVGMWGPDDPDSRKPMVWPDLTYEDEASDPLGRFRQPDPVAPDLELRETYRRLIALRKANSALFSEGSVRLLLADPGGAVLAYERVLDEGGGARRAVVLFNRSERAATVQIPVMDGVYRVAYAAGSWALADTITVSGEAVRLALPPLGACVWILE